MTFRAFPSREATRASARQAVVAALVSTSPIASQMLPSRPGFKEPGPPAIFEPSHISGLDITPRVNSVESSATDDVLLFEGWSIDYMYDESGRHKILVTLPGVNTRRLHARVEEGRLRITGKHKHKERGQLLVDINKKLPKSADLSCSPMPLQLKVAENHILFIIPRLASCVT